MKTQTRLKKLYLTTTGFEGIWRLILEEYKQLKYLKITNKSFTTEELSSLEYSSNTSIKHLTLMGNFSVAMLTEVLKRLPNVETLVWNGYELNCSVQVLNTIETHLKKLTSLNIFYFQRGMDFNMEKSFFSLPELTIQAINFEFHAPKAWVNFAEKFPNLEKLEITSAADNNKPFPIEAFRHLLQNLRNLKELSLGVRVVSILVINEILRNPERLRKLKSAYFSKNMNTECINELNRGNQVQLFFSNDWTFTIPVHLSGRDVSYICFQSSADISFCKESMKLFHISNFD